ncbi:MAG: TfoX/Sxy family protein [Actinomycetota bacterium]|nr:TfoX/Sxy family protein [Actinomycetota bacterium]
MPYSDDLAARVRARLSHFAILTERPVMSGLGFFLSDRMAVVVLDDRLCLRIDESGDPAVHDDAIVRPFEFAGRPVPGWFCIQAEHLDEPALALWVDRGVAGLGLPM